MGKAIKRRPVDVQFDVSYRPFELNPDMPPEGRDRKAYRTAKFGSWARSQALDEQVAEAGRGEGLAFNYDRVARTPNTMLAHRLMWLAANEGGDQTLLADRLFAACFTDGLDLSDRLVLRDIALKAGLPAERVAAVLHGDLGDAEVRALAAVVCRRGVHSVPLFEVNGVAISGAQSVAVIEDALRRAAKQQEAA